MPWFALLLLLFSSGGFLPSLLTRAFVSLHWSPSTGLDAKVLSNVANEKHAEVRIFSSSKAHGTR